MSFLPTYINNVPQHPSKGAFALKNSKEISKSQILKQANRHSKIQQR